MALYAMAYISIAANKDMPESELLGILEAARKVNAAKGITGMLLYRDGFFIQALEGEETIIDELFEKVKKDRRHYNVLQLYKEPIRTRYFPEWAMGFESPNIDGLKQQPGFSEYMLKQHGESLTQLSTQFDKTVKELLQKFCL
jgi:hypothetical protein